MPRRYSETIDDQALEGLASLGLTNVELGDLIGVKPEWLTDHKSEILRKGRARLKQSLRRQQIKTALAGNATMQIWLGKQYLSQTEHASMTVQAAASSLLVTPTVLEQLQQSYTLTLEEIRTTKRLASPAGAAGGTPVDRGGLPKTDHVSSCSKMNTVDNGDGEDHAVANGGIECDLVNHRVDYVDADYGVTVVGDDGAADEFLPKRTAGDEREEIEEERERIHRKIEVEDFVPSPGKVGRPKGSLTRKSGKGIPGPRKKGKA